MTVWVYGDSQVINSSVNATNGTTLTYNWTGIGLGQHNWTVILNNGIKNSTLAYNYLNIINLTILCQGGGPYQSNPLVSINGNISNGTSILSSQPINISVYKSGSLITSTSLNSLSDGSFYTSFYGLADGNYSLNVSSVYQGYTALCADNFTIGVVPTSASLVLDKIVSLQQINSTSVIYNIILIAINKGGSNATNVNITDP